jgi:hypothetical protein
MMYRVARRRYKESRDAVPLFDFPNIGVVSALADNRISGFEH